ncbi:MAG: hypothetical protein IJX15_04415, partial [Ruminiclostridium sp.]|nr:hypothetical protein [Ruminiclostridium sp.]
MKKSRFLRKLVSVFLAGTMILNGVTASGETTSFNEQTTISSLDTYLNETLPERVEAINKTRSSASVQEAIREYVDEVLP